MSRASQTGFLLLSLTLTGCGALADVVNQFDQPQAAVSPTATTVSPTVIAPTATASPGAAEALSEEPPDTVITVWMAEQFAPISDTPASQVFLQELIDFDQNFPDIQVEVFAKRVSGTGGMLAYLRTAPPVAPGVLPDIALMHREGLIQASSEALIVPMADLLDPAIEEGLYPVARELGMVNDILVGLPFLLEVQHAVYRNTVFTADPPASFEQVLNSPVPYVFPAGTVTTVNQTILEQYIAAGGRLFDTESESPALDVEPLTVVLRFYAEGREAGVIDPVIFQYANPNDAWLLYKEGSAALASVSSTTYLLERAEVRSTTPISTPTVTGEPHALASGWFWVITTSDPERQAAAMLLLNFFMNPINHGIYAQASGWLPAQPAALAVWGDGDTYVAFADTLLIAARPLPDNALRTQVGVVIQEALEDVLLNGTLPAQAASAAAAKINPTESD